ncbi:hypothetical protein ACQZSN_18510 [Clostridioides difficile]
MRNLGNTNMKIKRVGFGGIPIQRITQDDTNLVINELEKYSLQGTTQGRYLTGGVPPVRFSM